MLSPQLVVPLQMWWREGERRNVMLPSPDARRSGRHCGFDTGPRARSDRAKPTRLGASTECATRGRQVKGKGRT